MGFGLSLGPKLKNKSKMVTLKMPFMHGMERKYKINQ